MIVRIRFGRGARVTRRPGKNARIAGGFSTVATLAAVSCGTLGCWRLGHDLGWTGDFAFSSGLLSHWQIWLSAAGVFEYIAWRLARYARAAREQHRGVDESGASRERLHATVNS